MPANPTFEVKVERETNGSTEMGIEFELEWKEGGGASTDDGGLSVE